MQCCRISEEEKQQRIMNRQINERIKLDKKLAKREFKVLLLGETFFVENSETPLSHICKKWRICMRQL